MTIDPGRFQKLLDTCKLEQLFNELGWDRSRLQPQPVSINSETFTLTTIAQKRGVAVLFCSPDASGNIPPRPTLLKIEKEAAKLAHEHLLIFANAAKSVLTWLWVLRSPGQPTATRTHTWHQGTSGESLRQKLNQIVWSLEEEEAIPLPTFGLDEEEAAPLPLFGLEEEEPAAPQAPPAPRQRTRGLGAGARGRRVRAKRGASGSAPGERMRPRGRDYTRCMVIVEKLYIAASARGGPAGLRSRS